MGVGSLKNETVIIRGHPDGVSIPETFRPGFGYFDSSQRQIRAVFHNHPAGGGFVDNYSPSGICWGKANIEWNRGGDMPFFIKNGQRSSLIGTKNECYLSGDQLFPDEYFVARWRVPTPAEIGVINTGELRLSLRSISE